MSNTKLFDLDLDVDLDFNKSNSVKEDASKSRSNNFVLDIVSFFLFFELVRQSNENIPNRITQIKTDISMFDNCVVGTTLSTAYITPAKTIYFIQFFTLTCFVFSIIPM